MGVLDGIHPDLLGHVPDVAFPSRATVYRPTKVEKADGQVKRSFTSVVYADVPCRIVPSVLTRNMGETYREAGGFTRSRVDFGLLCKGAYPLITAECRVVIDGTSYKVSGAPDIDGNGLMTRLHLNDNQPWTE